jgi:hypothetical protein
MNENYARDIEKSLQTETGAPLFTPQILHYESTAQHLNSDVFTKLYDLSKFRDMKSKDNLNKHLEEIQRLAEAKLMTDKTEEINNRLKKDSYIKLFEKLDYDNDSIIKYDNKLEQIIKENFNETVGRYLAPIVECLKNQDETLNVEEFSVTMDQIFSNLSVNEKRSFINNLRERKKPVEDRNNFTFTPQISEKTRKVFSSSKKYSKDLIARNEEFVKQKNQFLSSKKEEKIKEELNCNFFINP